MCSPAALLISVAAALVPVPTSRPPIILCRTRKHAQQKHKHNMYVPASWPLACRSAWKASRTFPRLAQQSSPKMNVIARAGAQAPVVALDSKYRNRADKLASITAPWQPALLILVPLQMRCCCVATPAERRRSMVAAAGEHALHPNNMLAVRDLLAYPSVEYSSVGALAVAAADL